MNRYSLLRLLLFTLSAGALTAADMLQPPGPSLAPAEGWYGILRRNVGGMLEKRSDGVTDDDAVAGLDLEKWTTETVQMCAAALNSTTTATNPAGVAACWNLPVVLRDSGVFVADLRIFRVAKPTGDWVNVNLSSYDVLIEYDGSAAIQARNLTVGEVAAAKTGMKGSTLAKVMDAEFIGSLEHTLVEAALVEYVPLVTLKPTN